MGTTLRISKIDAAVHQLDRAIQLVVDHNDWICAVTLAGAAEEILGKAVKEHAVLQRMKTTLAAEYDMTEAVVSQRHLNRLKNWLKHWDDVTKDDVGEFEPDAEAINYIVRALVNLLALDKSLPSQGLRFLDWVDRNPQHGPLPPATKAFASLARK